MLTFRNIPAIPNRERSGAEQDCFVDPEPGAVSAQGRVDFDGRKNHSESAADSHEVAVRFVASSS